MPTITECFQILATFVLVTTAWIFFRAPDVSTATEYISLIGTQSPLYKSGMIYVIIMLMLDWVNRRDERNPFENKYPILTMVVLLVAIVIFRYEDTSNIEFIYFQF